MNWKRDIYSIERHPFKTFVPPNTEILIIGTFPTHRDNFQFEFFYSGKDNSFWKIIEQVFQHPFNHYLGEEAIEERQVFLTNKKIGITDMHQLCYRKNGHSKDEDLYPIILNDIFSLLNNSPGINRIVLTSRTPIFGSLGLLQTYFLQKNRELNELSKRPDKILEGKFDYCEREIKLLVPYSPSPRLIKDNITTMAELVKMYSICLK